MNDDIKFTRSGPAEYTAEMKKQEVKYSSHYDEYTIKKKVPVGILDSFFGSHENASNNISGFILTLLIFAGIITIFCKANISAIDFWHMIIPVVTLVFGYLFASKT